MVASSARPGGQEPVEVDDREKSAVFIQQHAASEHEPGMLTAAVAVGSAEATKGRPFGKAGIVAKTPVRYGRRRRRGSGKRRDADDAGRAKLRAQKGKMADGVDGDAARAGRARG